MSVLMLRMIEFRAFYTPHVFYVPQVVGTSISLNSACDIFAIDADSYQSKSRSEELAAKNHDLKVALALVTSMLVAKIAARNDTSAPPETHHLLEGKENALHQACGYGVNTALSMGLFKTQRYAAMCDSVDRENGKLLVALESVVAQCIQQIMKAHKDRRSISRPRPRSTTSLAAKTTDTVANPDPTYSQCAVHRLHIQQTSFIMVSQLMETTNNTPSSPVASVSSPQSRATTTSISGFGIAPPSQAPRQLTEL